MSLKGLNFRDEGSGNFDKNLTGRLYELGDEMRLVHEHLPHAFMAGVLLLPIEAAVGFVGLYADGAAAGGFRRGAVRFLDVSKPPPRRGRPLLAETLSMQEVAEAIVARARYEEGIVWGAAEPEE
ncbi:hypothetical protein [Amaricoccus sp.]|uniref:hypothetical protein n=1 Tax=Amaricoccus sp. TaxID=1872485 RepID=UPI001B57FF50|nr:hypothetical protein [Amaricoccus sp.]MBP7242046.1 hypothetical protein [Amaricoccus sp.]